MEIAKFILTAIGTFLSVIALSFTVFQYWRKKQEEKFAALKEDLVSMVQKEIQARYDSLARFDRRLEFLERSVLQGIENRLSMIEGELRGLKPVMNAIQNWFINNTGKN